MKSFEKFQAFLFIVLVSAVFFFGGFYFGKRGYNVEVKQNPPKVEVVNKNPSGDKVDFELFWNVWDLVSQKYLMRPVDTKKMVYGAIRGMVASLDDPYTEFLPPVLNENFDNQLNGKYEGIGAELDLRDDQLVIVAPLDGSPAKEAGLKPGDKILKIEDTVTFGMTVTEAVMKIRGQGGTSVKLTIQSGEDQPREITLTRRVIKVASVKWEDKGDGTAYIRISRFGEDTNANWDKAISEINIKMKQLDAVVIDLRGNPGGYLQSAVHIAGEFFRNKAVVIEEDASGKQTPYETKRIGNLQKIPGVYVLIDGGSASSSEILAGALRDNIKAVLVGEKSFGKGTVQEPIDFSDKSSLHVTIAKWLTPSKFWVHKVGLTPDHDVKITDEDLKAGKDPQLEKALELAKEL
jgi:carboxyl-terminal processing protease